MKIDPIRFSKNLYRQDALEASVHAYSALAKFRIESHDAEIHVFIEVNEPTHAKPIRDAFCTHALFETIVKHREAVGAKL